MGLQNPGQGFFPGPLPGQSHHPIVHPPQLPSALPLPKRTHGPATWNPPQGHLTRSERCPHLDAALQIANAVINTGNCRAWFDRRVVNHGATPPGTFDVWVSPCLFGNTGMTIPILGNNIYLSQAACCEPVPVLALVIVHEIAHHYCPPYGSGGETCAAEGDMACTNQVYKAATDTGYGLQPASPCHTHRCPECPEIGFPAFEPKW
jgi:hypothetical protein